MNLYRIPATLWVRADTKKDAIEEIHEFAKYHFHQDNNMMSIETNDKEARLEEEDYC